MDESCFQKADGIVVNVVYDNQLGVQSTFWKVPELAEMYISGPKNDHLVA